MHNLRYTSVLSAIAVAILAATVLTPAKSFATTSNAQLTGSELVTACRKADMAWVNFCNGYLQAVVDSIRKGDKICVPAITTRAELVTVAVRGIAPSTRLRAMNAYDAVVSVLQRRYPCR